MDSKVLITEAMEIIEKASDPTIIRVVDGEKHPSEEVMHILRLKILKEDLEIDRKGVESMLGNVFCELYSAFLAENEQLSKELKELYMKYEGIGDKEFTSLLKEHNKMLEEDEKEEQKKKLSQKTILITLITILIIIIIMLILTYIAL